MARYWAISYLHVGKVALTDWQVTLELGEQLVWRFELFDTYCEHCEVGFLLTSEM
jgi:hypothetical protein